MKDPRISEEVELNLGGLRALAGGDPHIIEIIEHYLMVATLMLEQK